MLMYFFKRENLSHYCKRQSSVTSHEWKVTQITICSLMYLFVLCLLLLALLEYTFHEAKA